MYSKLIIVPSEWYENCPYSIMEAMSYGKPVIGSNIGGIPELIQNGETGILFEPGNAKDLATKLKLLLSQPDLIKKFSKNAKIFIEQNCDKKKYYGELISLYQKARK